MTCHRRTWLIAATLAALMASRAAAAETEPGLTAEDQRSIQSVKDSLGGWGAPPWYDSSKDGERPIRVAARRAPLFNWWDLLEPLAWGAGMLLVGLLIYVLMRAFLDRQKNPLASGAGFRGQKALRAEIGRVEALPFALDKKPASLLDEAERLSRAGDFGRAMIYLYSYQLVELDKLQLIRLTRGKTNRQYLRELNARRRLRGLIEGSMVAFEHVFFGKHSLPQNAFEACWRQLSEFERLIREGAPAV